MPITPTPTNSLGTEDRSIVRWTWILTTAVPDGLPIDLPEWGDRTWTVGAVGDVFGAATVTVEGGADGVSFYPLNDAAGGAALTFTTGGCKTVIQNPYFMRPNLTVPGVGASITVSVLVRRANPLRQ